MLKNIFRIACSAVLSVVGAVGAMAEDGRVPVVVGGYQFEPFVEEEGGISRAFADFLNGAQGRYQFQFLEIPARRRYDLVAEDKVDLLFFEMMVWGWEGMASHVDVTQPLLSGREVLVARQPAGKLVTNLFSDLMEKKLALTLGYHYGFADFNADPDYLRQNFNVIFSERQRFTLRHVLAGTADLAVVNDAFLERAYSRDESLRDRVVLSPTPDQLYQLPVMVRRGGPATVHDVTRLLNTLSASGALKGFFEREGMGRFLVWE